MPWYDLCHKTNRDSECECSGIYVSNPYAVYTLEIYFISLFVNETNLLPVRVIS